jgi:sugar phosphate isomerase/epimerase
MKPSRLVTILMVLSSALSATNAALEFFAIDNGVGRGKWTAEQQARTLKELGYSGISYNFTNPEDLAAWQKAFRKQGLKIYGLYFFTCLDQPQAYDSRLPEAIRMLKGTDTVLWMTIRETKANGDHDMEAVKLVQEIAGMAEESGIRVALYGHAGFYVANASDALRISRKAQRPNVGPTINLCHEFMSGQADRLDKTINSVAPGAFLASINGVNPGAKKYILRLDQGDFDLVAYLKKLRTAGYHGPVGLQCYNVAGDIRENLAANITAWRAMVARLDEQSQSVSKRQTPSAKKNADP